MDLKDFLSNIALETYENRFKTQGYDSPFNIFTLNEEDLLKLEIRDFDHRQRILESVNSLDVRPWLELFNLERFYEKFKARGLSSVSDTKFNFNEDLMDEMDILVAGNRKRLIAAVDLLRGSTPHNSDDEQVVAEGYWAKPQTLSTSLYEFLCVDGRIKSENGLTSEPIVFLVDTGSDLVTVQSQLIEDLNLPFKGRIKSRGAHADRDMDIYSATLMIGGHHMEVEVMPDTHDSVGNTVVRHFKHRIDNSSHKWIIEADS